MSKELQDINDKLAKLETRQQANEDDSKKTLSIVTEIKMGLLGSKQLEVEGVVQKVSRHEKCLENLSRTDIINVVQDHKKYIEKDKKQKAMIAGGIAVLGFLWSAFIAWISLKK